MSVSVNIFNLHVNNLPFEQAISKVKRLAISHVPSYVCFANVHMVIESYLNKAFARRVNSANLVLPDGQPVAKLYRLFYQKEQERIAGMDFMPKLLESINAEKGQSYKIFLYGAAPDVVRTLLRTLPEKYQSVEIVGAVSPPFRALTTQEQDEYIQQINQSEANIVFVALGCPDQEKWMNEHHRKMNAVLLGVGGAFNVLAGLQRRAPKWMQKMSLEWFFRLMLEPKRLFKRYLITNSLFLWLVTKELIKNKLWTSHSRVASAVGQGMKT